MAAKAASKAGLVVEAAKKASAVAQMAALKVVRVGLLVLAVAATGAWTGASSRRNPYSPSSD